MNTAREIQTNFSDIDFLEIPEWNRDLMEKAFIKVRDDRFLLSGVETSPLRRIPWLYVKNGCFLKAALVRRRLEALGFPRIKKIFVFGDMKFDTALSTDGVMTYKDHVAVCVRCEGNVYIFDPSVYPQGPIRIIDWANLLERNSNHMMLKFSLCSEFTFAHNSDPKASSEDDEKGMRGGELKSVEFFTQDFLEKEYQWILALKMNPKLALYGERLAQQG
jgi:hypothetical protein